MLLGAVWAFPDQTLNPALRRIAPWAAKQYGWDLAIGSLHGAPWDRWTWKDVSLVPSEGQANPGPLRIDRIAELQVTWARVPRGLPQPADFREIWLRDGACTLRLAAPPPNAEPSPSRTFPWAPSSWPRIDVDGLALRVEQVGQGTFSTPHLRLGLQKAAPNAAGPRKVVLRMQDGRWVPAQGPTQELAAQAEIQLFEDRVAFQTLRLEQGSGWLQAKGAWPIEATRLESAEWSLQWQDLAWQDWNQLSGSARGAWEGHGWSLAELQAQLGDAVTLYGEDGFLPWDGGPRIAEARGSLVVGGERLDDLLAQIKPDPSEGDSGMDLGRFRLRASLSQGRVDLADASVVWHPAAFPSPVTIEATGSLDWPDPRSGTANAPKQAGLDLVGRWHLEAGQRATEEGVRMTWPSTEGRWSLRGRDPDWEGELLVEDLLFQVQPPDRASYDAQGQLRMALDEKGVRLEALRLDWTQDERSLGSIEGNGTFGSLQAWRSDPAKVPLHWNVRADCPELFPLAHFVPAIRRIEGSAQVDFQGSGTWEQPDWEGQGTIEAQSMRLTRGESWSDLQATLRLDRSQTATLQGNAHYGGGPVTATGTLDWTQAEPSLTAEVQAEGVPVLRTPDARLRADASLTLQGTPGAGHVAGQASVVYGRLRHQFDLSGKLLELLEERQRGSETPGEPIEWSWAFPAGWTAEIDLNTAQPVPVFSDLGQTNIRLDGRLVGRSGSMHPEGSLAIGSGKVALPGSTLTWKQGFLLFPQDGGPPRIEASGETRLAGHDITLSVRGDLLQPTLELSSIPFRPQYDLLVLLLTGSLPGNNDLSRATQSLSVYLAKDLLRRWLGSEPSEEEGLLDRLEITTGREVSESGLGTLEAMFRLSEQAAKERRALWITAERDRFEDMNFGLRWTWRPR